MRDVDIIIKTFNEEDTIVKCIKSAQAALRGIHGKIILVDSLSTDQTIAKAKKFPITILQITDPKLRRCGMGPQVGFNASKSNYVYVLDGDMTLERNFIHEALKVMKGNIVGVGGIIKEHTTLNGISKKMSMQYQKRKFGQVDMLEGGGLYSTKAVTKLGYLSNQALFSNEEADLGLKLSSMGYTLIRIPRHSVTHYRKGETSLGIIATKFQRHYFDGPGQVLRQNLFTPIFLGHCRRLRLYLLVLLYQVYSLISLTLAFFYLPAFWAWFLITSILLLFVLLWKHGNLKEWSFGLISWNIAAVGLLIGFLRSPQDPSLFDKRSIKIVN